VPRDPDLDLLVEVMEGSEVKDLVGERVVAEVALVVTQVTGVMVHTQLVQLL
jgi:hypothetical protein